MIVVWIIVALLFVSFGLIVLVGAPYVPTRQKDISVIFKQLRLKPHATVVDLGSGDGRVLIGAAKNGYKAIGYELNPFLWLISYLRTRRYGKLVQVKAKNLWQADIAKADVVFIFTAAPFVKRLQQKFSSELKSGALVVSYGFELDGHKPTKKIGPALVYRF